ncbi:TPA: hypothetical protein N2F35_001341 [Salmonella enterica]|nr:hypothetical protein [Salmonella enterica subsp. enterica serovar Landwasser]HCL5133406.1 hypothetical protein [Salmonella enterica]
MSLCVYCGQEGKVTREHILPAFIYEYQYNIGSGKMIGWQEKPKKLIYGEAKIKDVCTHCNVVILCELDGYVKNLLEKSGFFTENFSQKNVNIRYNYSLLSRWLLKVAFNSSRASDNKLFFFDKYKNIILGKTKDFSNFAMSAGLFKPLKLTAIEIIKYGKALKADSFGYVNPFIGRVSEIKFNSPEFSVKQIVIGALILHIIAFKDNLSREDKKKIIKEYLNKCKGMTLIRKNKSQINIVQTPLTFMDSMQHYMLHPDVEPQLEELLKKNN